MITRPLVPVPHFYQKYVDALKEDDLMDALKSNTRQFRKLLKSIPRKKVDYAYAEGKWTIKELLQHVIDSERVFVYRALTFARKDTTNLPSFDENMWGANAKASKRKWKDLVDEFFALRQANMAFFGSLDEDQLLHTGTANNNVVSVVGLGFISAGHVAHHMRILKERYLGKNDSAKKTKAEKKTEKKAQKKIKKAGKRARKAALNKLK